MTNPSALCMRVLSFVLLLASAAGFALPTSVGSVQACVKGVPRYGSGKCQMLGASDDRRRAVSTLLALTVGASVWGGGGKGASAADGAVEEISKRMDSAAERASSAAATLKQQQVRASNCPQDACVEAIALDSPLL